MEEEPLDDIKWARWTPRHIGTPLAAFQDDLALSEGYERQIRLHAMASYFLQEVTKKETLPRLLHFLDRYFRPAPLLLRKDIWLPKRVVQLLGVVHEPLAMVLGKPGEHIQDYWDHYEHPDCNNQAPRQEDFDRRAAQWLREVVLKKDVSALRMLMDALGKIPCALYPGISPGEIMDSLPPEEPAMPVLRKIHVELDRWVNLHGKLPSKKELRQTIFELDKATIGQNAQEIEKRNWTRYLEVMGLTGLPEDKRRERRI